jgi:MoxR-like ATPase
MFSDYGFPFNEMFPKGNADKVLDVFKKALEIIEEVAPAPQKFLALTFGGSAGKRLTLNLGQWYTLHYNPYNREIGGAIISFLLPKSHPEHAKTKSKEQFAALIEGNAYGGVTLPEAEFLTRFDELWPAIVDALRKAARYFANFKGTPYARSHRPELVDLVMDPIARKLMLKEGLDMDQLPSASAPLLSTEESSFTQETLPSLPNSYRIEDALAELFMPRGTLEHILEQLRRKKNIILQGAPGVGKTFIAKRLAWLHLGEKDDSNIEMVQFHQSYTYEDFVQGLRPTAEGNFALKDGCFYRLCRRALANPHQDFFLVIDEINRGNLSKILGELMMLIETDKRGQSLTLAYSEEPFTVPPNLYLIGTMNTADRSLSLVDYALRRRFAFLTLDPGFHTEAFSAHLRRFGVTTAQIRHIRDQMEALNDEIISDGTNLGSGYRIGHSFFTPVERVADFDKWFQSIVHYEIMPLLEEYWIDNPKKVRQFRLTFTGQAD